MGPPLCVSMPVRKKLPPADSGSKGPGRDITLHLGHWLSHDGPDFTARTRPPSSEPEPRWGERRLRPRAFGGVGWTVARGFPCIGGQSRGTRSDLRPEPVRLGRVSTGLEVERSDRLRRGRSRWGRPRALDGDTEVREDLPHHRRILDGPEQTQAPPALGAGQNVDREGPAQQLRPRRVRPRLGTRRAWARRSANGAAGRPGVSRVARGVRGKRGGGLSKRRRVLVPARIASPVASTWDRHVRESCHPGSARRNGSASRATIATARTRTAARTEPARRPNPAAAPPSSCGGVLRAAHART